MTSTTLKFVQVIREVWIWKVPAESSEGKAMVGEIDNWSCFLLSFSLLLPPLSLTPVPNGTTGSQVEMMTLLRRQLLPRQPKLYFVVQCNPRTTNMRRVRSGHLRMKYETKSMSRQSMADKYRANGAGF